MGTETLPVETGTGHYIRSGIVTGFDSGGVPLVVICDDSAGPLMSLPAKWCVPVQREDAGRSVALAFLEGDRHQPVILGFLNQDVPGVPAKPVQPTLTLNADSEVVIQCGKASIVLTRAGKILLRGEFIASQSTGLNQIDGACVKIN